MSTPTTEWEWTAPDSMPKNPSRGQFRSGAASWGSAMRCPPYWQRMALPHITALLNLFQQMPHLRLLRPEIHLGRIERRHDTRDPLADLDSGALDRFHLLRIIRQQAHPA